MDTDFNILDFIDPINVNKQTLIQETIDKQKKLNLHDNVKCCKRFDTFLMGSASVVGCHGNIKYTRCC